MTGLPLRASAHRSSAASQAAPLFSAQPATGPWPLVPEWPSATDTTLAPIGVVTLDGIAWAAPSFDIEYTLTVQLHLPFFEKCPKSKGCHNYSDPLQITVYIGFDPSHPETVYGIICVNNPVIYTDPSGHWIGWDDLIAAVVGAIAGGIMASQNGQNVFQGALTGAAAAWVGWNTFGSTAPALEGAIEGAAGMCGPAYTGMANAGAGIAAGAASGAVAGGMGAAFNGGNVGQAMLIGAAYGAATGFVTGGIGVLSGWASGWSGATYGTTDPTIALQADMSPDPSMMVAGDNAVPVNRTIPPGIPTAEQEALQDAGLLDPINLLPAGRVAGTGQTLITGFTKHGLNQVISRDGVGVSSAAILDAVKNPSQVIAQANGAIKYVGQNATVILNKAGEVITAWARNSAGWRIGP